MSHIDNMMFLNIAEKWLLVRSGRTVIIAPGSVSLLQPHLSSGSSLPCAENSSDQALWLGSAGQELSDAELDTAPLKFCLSLGTHIVAECSALVVFLETPCVDENVPFQMFLKDWRITRLSNRH